jgi:hypothetical protein
MLTATFEGRQIGLRYDYDLVPAADRNFVISAAVKIKFHAAAAGSHVATAGGQLIEAKHRLPHGQWGDWLRVEFDLGERTAQQWMRVHEMAVSLELDPDVLDELGLSALYLLAQRSTSDAIRDAAFSAVLDGQKVTHKMVMELIGMAEGKAKPAAPIAKPAAPAPRSFDPDRDWTKPATADRAASAPAAPDYGAHDVADEEAGTARPAAAAAKLHHVPETAQEFLEMCERCLARGIDHLAATVHPKFSTPTSVRFGAVADQIMDLQAALTDRAVRAAA